MKFALMAVVGLLATGCALGGPTQDRFSKKTTRDPQVTSVLAGHSLLIQDRDATCAKTTLLMHRDLRSLGHQTLLDKP